MTEVALLTGCASGIGKALALEMHSRRLEDGQPAYKVYATDFRYDVVKGLEAEGLSVLELDVTKQESINSAVAHVLKEEGHLDVCICNAGIAVTGFIAEIDYKEVERLFKVNVHGVFRTAQAVAGHMMSRRSGNIVIMGSVNAFFTPICNGVYSGAKAAVIAMAETLSRELLPFDVLVTTVIPGWVRSEIVQSAPADYSRYDRPGSFYKETVPVLKAARVQSTNRGSTTSEAAFDITNSLLRKPKPNRYEYTGKMLTLALFWGYAQIWWHPRKLATDLQWQCRIYECAKKGPTQWDGQYVKPPPSETPKIEANGEKIEGEKVENAEQEEEKKEQPVVVKKPILPLWIRATFSRKY